VGELETHEPVTADVFLGECRFMAASLRSVRETVPNIAWRAAPTQGLWPGVTPNPIAGRQRRFVLASCHQTLVFRDLRTRSGGFMRLQALVAIFLALCVEGVARAQQPRSPAIGQEQTSVDVYFLRNEVYFLTNGRANAVAVVTGDGVVLLDAMPTGWGARVLEALQKVTYMSPTAIVNTHAHEDHAGADREYPEAKQVGMHQTSGKRLARSAGGAGQTVTTFSDQMTLNVGNRPLHLYYFGRGHTDGDVIVVIPDINAAYTGDLFAEKALPVVDPASGGSALALPETLKRAADQITGVDRVITGHGRWPGNKPNTAGIQGWPTWNDFREYAAFTRDFVDAATAAWKKGRSAEQAAAELRMPEKYKDYRLDGAKALIATIFDELKQSSGAQR
jgi:glyoxylase-like metal-dependent hydrolase (beta-lactamase superfamily II)